MKRRIYWSMCATSVALVLLTALLTLTSAYGLLLRQAKRGLADEHRLVALTLETLGADAGAYLETLDMKFPNSRITVILEDGTVEFDTDGDQTGMENHRGRPEVEAAFSTGMGEDIRKSATMGQDTYYYAARLDNNTVLRVSKQTSSIGAVFVSIIPLMLGIMVLVLASSLFLSSRLSRRLLRPLEGLAENLEAGESLRGYDELEPFFMKIREQRRQIREQIEHLREERDTVSAITSNMKEGLILLDLGRSILSVNPSALSLLGARGGDYTGKNLLSLSRDPRFSACVEQALSGTGGDEVIRRDGLSCHLFASPVYNREEVCGVIVLLLDVTEQQKAEKIRRDFSANVSHELKTPLTSISGFAELIESGMAASDADIRKFAGRISREASRLITLTEDIIRLSRIEEGGEMETEPVALKALCEAAASALQYTADQKQVTITVTGDPLTVNGNLRMLDEMIYNLLDNGIKYNQTGGQVSISLRREPSYGVIAVSDTGIGIPEPHRERVFERFYRVDTSRSKQTGGTGLGLSIVRHIVERHDGTITLESLPDLGTTVTVRLPLPG